MDLKFSGLLGLIHLVIVVYVILQVAQSRASEGKKVLWIVAVLFLPLLGPLVWYFMGPRK
ncbi:MAG: PLD nuclease N-terminal domain-containing protein [Pseudomonadota bacterium]